MLEINIQKYIFQQNMAIFIASDVSFLNPCCDGNVHTYDAT